MATAYPGSRISRDPPSARLADTIYDILPSRALDISTADLRSTPPDPVENHIDTAPKRKGTITPEDAARTPSFLERHLKRTRAQPSSQQRGHAELHTSVCLNLNSASNAATSDLWILPDFEDWSAEMEQSQLLPLKRGGDGTWAPLLQRAASSNRERLRRRLEGDGWDFVGGRYGEDENVYAAGSVSGEESVDEEFDVVVLDVVAVS
jgi:hypothetical protein